MRRHLAVPTVLAGVLLSGALLTGCGDDDGAATDAPTASGSSSSAGAPSSATPTAKPVSVQKTCGELYHPPAQLMPRAIELVHASPSAEDASSAGEIVDGLAEVEGHSLGPLAEDIAVVRDGVDRQRSAAGDGGDAPDVKAFDAAANRLARHCEFYND